ncbi:exonuclease domain-containing protein [Croceimicrobium sp.]|uniref:exonuclease domain-containing protein n=1 Tax=Croceimicrobium sp. TaxID=2828340 RepID=UPI003BACF876
MDFITIDFETATPERNSPCEIGLAFVEQDEVKAVKSWLIKPAYYPDFDPFNISIHGITPKDVEDSPEFPEVWSEIKSMLEGQFLIAHNAGFDMSVLRRTLELYQIPFPELEYSCSYIFSKKVWAGLPSYDLKSLCHYHSIPLKHHRAANDSEATALLSLKAFQEAEVQVKEDFPLKLKTTIGRLFDGGYSASRTKREYPLTKTEEIVGDPTKHNPDSPVYGKTVVFTGTLMSMARKDAQQLVADVGGVNAKGVTKKTDILVVGQQDYRVVGEDGMSSKQEKAIKLIESGAGLEILSEDEFLRSL